MSYGSIHSGFFQPFLSFPLFPCSGMVLFMGWKVIPAPVPKASPSSPSPCLMFTLPFCSFRVFYLLCLCGILPFLKYVFIEVPLAFLMELAMSCSGCLESQLCPAQGSPCPFLTEKAPAASLLVSALQLHPLHFCSLISYARS